MDVTPVIIACISLSIIVLADAHDAQNVGGDFGRSWLQQHGVQSSSATETSNSLWNWGNAPKGYTFSNGGVIPPGYGTQWYYPGLVANGTPIIINNTAMAGNNYLLPNLQLSLPEDAWLLSQLTGRPVAIVETSKGLLF